jgi:phage tail P2-like protein
MDLSNISILDLMPPNLAADKNIRMMAEAFDEVLRDIIKKIPDVEIISNLTLNQIVNETLIDLLAWQFHVDFYEPELPIEIKRELVLKSLDWHYRKGTPSVVEEIVSTVFTRAKVQEWYEYGGRPYRFRIATEEQILDAETLKKFMRAINSVKNTRSFLDNLTYLMDFIDEMTINEENRIVVRRRDYDLYPGGLRYDGRFKYDHGEFLRFDGQNKYDGSWVYDLVFGVSGTVSDTIRIPSRYDATWAFDGNRQYSGDFSLYAPEDIPTPVTFNNRMKDDLSIRMKLERFEDRMEIVPRYDGHLMYQGWKYGADNPSMIDASMKIRITREYRYNGRWQYWSRSYDGSWRYDGTLVYSSGITYSGSKTIEEEIE